MCEPIQSQVDFEKKKKTTETDLHEIERFIQKIILCVCFVNDQYRREKDDEIYKFKKMINSFPYWKSPETD